MKIPAKLAQLLRDSANPNQQVAMAAFEQLAATALIEPLRNAILPGDIVSDIFQRVDLEPDAMPEFPLDLIAPGTEKDYVAYTVPNAGRIPERHVEGDYVMVPTYQIGNAIDWLLRYARHARWDIVARAMEVFEMGFTKKKNDDGWHTLMACGVDRNIIVYDGNASAGQFTKRLISLAKVVMRRNGGGNSASTNRRRLTDLYASPESLEDVRNWGMDQADQFTLREIFLSDDNVLRQIFGVNLHAIDELGQNQEYQNFFSNQLSGALASGDIELVVGLDQTKQTFYNPVKMDIELFQDPTLHRQQRAGVYGWAELGWGALDSRDVLLMSY